MTAAGARPDPGFVGRVDEVARLAEMLRSARGGAAPVSLVLGEAGIGKSRLAARIAAEARELGYDVVWTEAEEGAGPFSALAGLRPSGDRGVGDDARWQELEDVAATIAARAPVLVIVEDHHLADASSAWVVERLSRHLLGVAAPLLVTARSDEPGQDKVARLASAADHVVRLAGMSLEESARLAELAAPGSGVDGAGIWARTGGVPLFVREGAVLAADGGTSHVSADLLGRRIARLGTETARVLAALAVAPPGTSLVVLSRALGQPLAEVVAAIDAGRAEDLVVDERSGGIRFRHALLTEAAADAVPVAELRRLRLALADAIAADGGASALAAAARQRLLALPAGDLGAVEESTVAAVVMLRAAGDEMTATALAELGARTLATFGAPAASVVRLHVERGEALQALGDRDHAEDAFVAASVVEADLDPTLRARAEVGLAWFANPFVPDPGIVRRLQQAAAELGDEDSPLRAAVLGRIAVASVAAPAAREVGRRAADDALAMARRIGDPALIVQALADRHLAPLTPADFSAREQAAAEIIDLGERLGRPDVALIGYEWTFGERLAQADVEGAEQALARLELYAHLVPSPHWRFAVGLRRASLLCLGDDREGALTTLDEAVRSADGWLNQGEIQGIALGFRSIAVYLYGVPDPELAPTYQRNAEIVGDLPAPFLHAGLSLAAWVLGDQERARHHFRLTAAGIETIAVGLESVFALQICGMAAVGIGDVVAARSIRPLLEPFADRLTASGAIVVPVATILALICDLVGDSTSAVAHHRTGIAVAERAGSAVMTARCRALAAAPEASPTPTPSPSPGRGLGAVRRVEGGWSFATPLGSASVEESRGLVQLIEVLRANGREVAALDLAGSREGLVPVQADLGPALDSEAKRAYRARIADLRGEIDEAEEMNDPDRATRARWELDLLMEELARAVGLGGRDRPQGATDERARVNVTRSLKRAIAAVAAKAPELGSHLEASVRTGRQCRYQPDPAVALTWDVVAGP